MAKYAMEKYKDILSVSFISWQWGGEGSWNLSTWKTRRLSNIVNVMGSRYLATVGATALVQFKEVHLPVQQIPLSISNDWKTSFVHNRKSYTGNTPSLFRISTQHIRQHSWYRHILHEILRHQQQEVLFKMTGNKINRLIVKFIRPSWESLTWIANTLS